MGGIGSGRHTTRPSAEAASQLRIGRDRAANVRLLARPSNLGRGAVMLWRCPGCDAPARVLYDTGEAWRCRRCHPVVYTSSRASDGRVSALLANPEALNPDTLSELVLFKLAIRVMEAPMPQPRNRIIALLEAGGFKVERQGDEWVVLDGTDRRTDGAPIVVARGAKLFTVGAEALAWLRRNRDAAIQALAATIDDDHDAD